MSFIDSVIVAHKQIQTVEDVSTLIDDQLGEIFKQIERLAFSTTPEDDKRRTELVAQKDILIALKVAITSH